MKACADPQDWLQSWALSCCGSVTFLNSVTGRAVVSPHTEQEEGTAALGSASRLPHRPPAATGRGPSPGWTAEGRARHGSGEASEPVAADSV